MGYEFDERDLRSIQKKVNQIKGWVLFLGIMQIITIVFWLLVFIAGMTSPMYF